MNTKAFFSCGGGSNLILGTGTENQVFLLSVRRNLAIHRSDIPFVIW